MLVQQEAEVGGGALGRAGGGDGQEHALSLPGAGGDDQRFSQGPPPARGWTLPVGYDSCDWTWAEISSRWSRSARSRIWR